jgi:hypothetical protein
MNFNLHDLKLGFESLFVFGEGVDTPKTQEQLPIIKKKRLFITFYFIIFIYCFLDQINCLNHIKTRLMSDI